MITFEFWLLNYILSWGGFKVLFQGYSVLPIPPIGVTAKLNVYTTSFTLKFFVLGFVQKIKENLEHNQLDVSNHTAN